MKFAVFGSCVSRDVFNFLDNQSYMVLLRREGFLSEVCMTGSGWK